MMYKWYHLQIHDPYVPLKLLFIMHIISIVYNQKYWYIIWKTPSASLSPVTAVFAPASRNITTNWHVAIMLLYSYCDNPAFPVKFTAGAMIFSVAMLLHSYEPTTTDRLWNYQRRSFQMASQENKLTNPYTLNPIFKSFLNFPLFTNALTNAVHLWTYQRRLFSHFTQANKMRSENGQDRWEVDPSTDHVWCVQKLRSDNI
jgi:hypothetical protein